MNPRWLAYCRAHGLDPGVAPLTGFVPWMVEQQARWMDETGQRRTTDPLTREQNAAFGAWLGAQTESRERYWIRLMRAARTAMRPPLAPAAASANEAGCLGETCHAEEG
jgi:hypothetical protein